MGTAYATMLSAKTYLRLKATNDNKLLVCHLCHRHFEIGDKVVFGYGSSRKRYDLGCAERINLDFTPLKEEESTTTSTAPTEEGKA